ncbi:S8 family serine peptidase [Spiroplasma endosymbiont of Cantharis nigra]|uniref:S8 family serine peptidase n=1 Tax=Spiroplasma endosymbiont of Cantharis nigra TaxID=3066278 RepID=UPI0030CD7752
MAVKLKATKFQEKGNRGRIDNKSFEEVNEIVQKNKTKLLSITKKVENFNSTIEGKVIFFIEYINIIPPKTKRFIFNIDGNPENILNIKQKSISSKKIDGKSYIRIFYEINSNEYNKLISMLKKFLNYSAELYVRGKDEYFLACIILCEGFSQEYYSYSVINKAYVSTLPLPWVFEDLVSRKIISKNDFNSDLNFGFFTGEQVKKINELYPFMIIEVFNSMTLYESPINILDMDIKDKNIELDKPRQTIIGVIDSGNNLPEPFSKYIIGIEDWREFKKFSNNEHGSMVSSLLVANDELNPGSADKLGNFFIKHFEMLEPIIEEGKPQLSFEHLQNNLETIISQNSDIQVWNLSIGGIKSPYSPIMSKVGAFLDYIARKYNVLFIISSGNLREKVFNPMESLCMPGDSLNALTVGSIQKVKNNIVPANYSSIGQILYFEKPEVSTFGGPENSDSTSTVAYWNGLNYGIKGTSISAPRISRIAAHLIEEGFSPLEAKAKILAMSVRERPSKKSSSFGWVDNSLLLKPTLKVTISLTNKNPKYLDIKIPKGVTEIIIGASHFVQPNSIFGEEYSIHNFDVGLIWYNSDEESNNPEHKEVTKKVGAKEKSNNDSKYFNEKLLRLEAGKYFSSSKFRYLKENIDNARLDGIYQKKFTNDNAQLAIRVKKLDLFDTKEEQVESVAIAILLIGNVTENDFIIENKAIVELEAEVEIYS